MRATTVVSLFMGEWHLVNGDRPQCGLLQPANSTVRGL
jgi:hypothetical protein